MQFLKLVLRNALRHKLRTGLTVLGLVVAILAFGLLQTVVDAWYAGAESAAPNRLVTRNAISLAFSMPLHYREKIRAVDGVRTVGAANWFGGIYQDPKNFFAQFAIDPAPYFTMYPEYRIKEDELRAFLRDRKGAVIGRKLADELRLQGRRHDPAAGHDLPRHLGVHGARDLRRRGGEDRHLADVLPLGLPQRDGEGEIAAPRRPGRRVRGPDRRSRRARRRSRARSTRQFVNSLAETLTETEKAFQLGFVAMTEAIVVAIRIVSFVVIFIILAVMANTMAMTARERLARVRDAQGARLRSRLRRAARASASRWRSRVIGAGARHRADLPGERGVRRQDGHALPGVRGERRDGRAAGRVRARRRRRGGAAPGRRAARVKIVEGLRAIG